MNRVIAPKDLKVKPELEMFRQIQEIRKIARYFRSEDEMWKEEFERLKHSLVTSLISSDNLKNLLSYLIYHLRREITELPNELQEIWEHEADVQLHELVAKQETVDALLELFYEVLVITYEKMKMNREYNSHSGLMNQIKQYVEMNHHNFELSLMHLSDQFGLQASYISRLFKERFGIGFSEYVTNVRLEAAIRLLQATEESIQDISLSVGYLNTATFIRAFKKHVGTTPGHYRKEKVEIYG